jgi:hypothetical protein
VSSEPIQPRRAIEREAARQRKIRLRRGWLNEVAPILLTVLALQLIPTAIIDVTEAVASATVWEVLDAGLSVTAAAVVVLLAYWAWWVHWQEKR